MLLWVTNEADLSLATGAVHDQRLDLDLLRHQEGSVRILELTRHSGCFTDGRAVGKTVVTVSAVKEVEIVDTQKVGIYGINEFQFRDSVLVVSTDIPLRLAFFVEYLDIKIWSS